MLRVAVSLLVWLLALGSAYPQSVGFGTLGTGPTIPYTGYVTTRGAVPGNIVAPATATLGMSRTHVVARTAITALQLVIPTWYVAGGSEQPLGATATITASVEYPSGTCTQVKFAGSSSVTAASKINQFSDSTAVAIPNGADVWIRIFWSSSAGLINSSTADTGNGDAYNIGTSGIADQTVTCGVVPNTASGRMFAPFAVLGTTTQPSVFIIGDSRTACSFDAFSPTSDCGEDARSIGPVFAYVNCGIAGDSAQAWVSSHVMRMGVGQFASHALLELTINDITTGQSAAGIEANLTAIAGYFSKPVWLTTTPPVSSSTDSWATKVNQTTNSHNAALTTVNDWKRTSPAGFAGFFEVANVVSPTQDSGLWNCGPLATCLPPTNTPGTALYCTADGTHESAVCYALIQSSGAINTSLITR